MSLRRKTPLQSENIEPVSCTIDLRHRILQALPFFRDLSVGQITEINTFFHERGFAENDVIYAAGEPTTTLYVVAAGKVKLVRHTLTGQDVLLDLLTSGELFGSIPVLGDSEYLETAQAQTVCCVLSASAEDFQAILRRYPSVALALLEILAERLRAAHQMIQQLHASSVESRLAATLLKLAEKLGEEQRGSTLIQVPISR